MKRSTKKIIAKAGLGVALGVGGITAAEGMGEAQPSKNDLEIIGYGVTAASLLYGIGAAVSSRIAEVDRVGERDRRIGEIRGQLPVIKRQHNIFKALLDIRSAQRGFTLSEQARSVLDPVFQAYRVDYTDEETVLTSLLYTKNSLMNLATFGADDPQVRAENQADIADVCLVLDKIAPIDEMDHKTPEVVDGERHWFDYIQREVVAAQQLAE